MVSMYKFNCFVVLLLFTPAQSASAYKELNSAEYTQYINEQQWYNPACIFFNSSATSYQNYTNVLQSLNTSLEKKNMKLYISSKQVLSTEFDFSCFVKQKSPFFFKMENILKSKQMERLLGKFLDPDVIQMKVAKDIHLENLVSRESKTVIVFLPGNLWMNTQSNLLQLMLEFEQPSLQLVFVPPNTNVERELVPYLQVNEFPCVFVLARQYSQQKFKVLQSFHGPYQLTEMFLRLHFIVQDLIAITPSPDQLDDLMSSKVSLTTILLICVFTSSNSASYNFLHAYQRSMLHFKSKYPHIKFIITNIADTKISIVLMRHLKIYDVGNLPFVVALWTEEVSGNRVIRQKTLTSQISPTPHITEVLLSDFGLLSLPNSLQSRKLVCKINETDVCTADEQVIEPSVPCVEKKKNVKPKQVKKKQQQQPLYITEKTWFNVFNQQNKRLAIHEPIHSSRLIFIIFIQDGCSFCELSMPVFRKVLQSQKFLNSTSIYLMNCSENRRVCSKYGITGYPTMILFRMLTFYEHFSCFEKNHLSEITSMDYHGDVEVNPILSWLSKMNQEQVYLVAASHNIPGELMKDVRLIAKLYTKKYIQRYLPRSLHGRLVPFKCFMDLCELLLNQVECFGTPAIDVTFSNKKEDLFLESIFLTRRDGFNLTLFQTGLPMKRSLDADHFAKGGLFHTAHKYDISNSFKCEDSIIKCNEVILKFVKEHTRLPVTYLTSTLLHSHQKGINYMWEKPVLIAFAHSDNITQGSQFYEKLYQLSLEIYKDINVAVVDVDVYSHWSSLFVPKYYYTSHYDRDEIPELLRYPRFCMIELHKHNRAAFFPPLKKLDRDYKVLHEFRQENFQASLKNFVQLYLKDKDALLIETERF